MKRRAFLQAATAAAAVSIAPAWLISTERPGGLFIALIQRGGDEATYHGYQRQAAPRDTATWNIDDAVAGNKIAISFPECSGRAQWITGFGICIGGSLMAVAELTAPLYVVAGVTPEFLPGALQMPADI